MIKSLPLVIALVVSNLGPQAVRAAPTGGSQVAESNEPERVVLEIDYAPLLKHQIPEAAENSAFFVREDVTKALRDVHGMEVVEDPAAPALIVRLAWVDYDKSVYRVEIAVRRPGQDLETITQFDRHFIHDTALSQGVAESLAEAVKELARPQQESKDSGAAGADPTHDQDESGEPAQTDGPGTTDDSRPRAPLATMGKAGIGLLAGGVVVAGVGAGLLSQGRKIDEQDGQPLEQTGRDYRFPGIAVLVSGGALVVAGAVMLGLDRRGAARRREAVVRVLPGLNGMTVVGRF